MKHGLVLLASLLIIVSAAEAPAMQNSSGGAAAPKAGQDPYAGMTPQEAMAMHWEEEAARRGGKFVCTNPAHHHSLSPQMHWLMEGGDN